MEVPSGQLIVIQLRILFNYEIPSFLSISLSKYVSCYGKKVYLPLASLHREDEIPVPCEATRPFVSLLFNHKSRHVLIALPECSRNIIILRYTLLEQQLSAKFK